MWSFLLYLFLAYSLYQLIFRFILPVYRTTRQIKKGFREMQERMQGHGQPLNGQPATASERATEKNKVAGDYIDFEEVKE